MMKFIEMGLYLFSRLMVVEIRSKYLAELSEVKLIIYFFVDLLPKPMLAFKNVPGP